MRETVTEGFSNWLADQNTTIAKDLKLNFKRLFEDSSLSEEEATLTLLATATSLAISPLQELARVALSQAGLGADVIREAEENAAIMGMLNTYYRFRHFIDSQEDEDAGEGYGPAKLRMLSLGNPAMGKEKFEMLAFAVSVINGCERCVTSHEKALLQLNVSRDKLHDLARLAAVLAGVKRLIPA